MLHPDWLAMLFVDRSHFSLLPRCCYTTETVEKTKKREKKEELCVLYVDVYSELSSCVHHNIISSAERSPQNQKVV